MKYKLTSKYQHSKRHADGRRRNKLLYFLNDILILEQKVPFDEEYEWGYQNHTSIKNEYLLDGRLYQDRQKKEINKHGKIREVKYPISKKILEQFNIPKGLKIEHARNKSDS